MEIRLKEGYLNTVLSDPFTGKMQSLRFLSKDMYIHYYNRGYQYLFEEILPIEEEKPVEEDKIEIEIENDKSE
jgi:hypothetical protein